MTIDVDIKRPQINVDIGFGLVEVVPEEKRYQGEYVVTPSQERQVLPTAGKLLESNVIVEPIPSNYGLITYNGYSITVS